MALHLSHEHYLIHSLQLGSLIVPRLQSAWSTYTTLMILLSLHLAINYVMVHGLVLRTLNWQRLWFGYALYLNNDKSHPPTPDVINPLERLYEKPGRLRDPLTGKDIGQITFGSSLGKILHGPLPPTMMSKIGSEGYTVWFDAKCLEYPTPDSVSPAVVGYPRVHICYHHSNTGAYPVRRAYLHAGFICYTIHQARSKDPAASLDAVDLVMTGYKATEGIYNSRHYAQGDFINKMKEYHWDMDSVEMESPRPDAVIFQYGYSYDQKSE
jgi:Vitamin B6 photo-protection and homoeostasis